MQNEGEKMERERERETDREGERERERETDRERERERWCGDCTKTTNPKNHRRSTVLRQAEYLLDVQVAYRSVTFETEFVFTYPEIRVR
jgi:hypothetical protein